MNILKLLPEQVIALNVEVAKLNEQFLKLLEEEREADRMRLTRYY